MPLNDREVKKLYTLLHDDAERLKTLWPSPLAFPMKELVSLGLDKNEGIVGFLDAYATFLGCMLISLYINESNKFPHKKLNQGVLHFLTQPTTLGQWLYIIRHGAHYFSIKKDDFLIPELLKFVSGVDDPLNLEKQPVKLIDGLLDDLNRFRKGIGHPQNLAKYLAKQGVEYLGDDLASGYLKARPFVALALRRLLLGSQFLARYWLFHLKNRVEDNIFDIHLFRGENPSQRELRIPQTVADYRDFSPDLHRNTLFLARVRRDDAEVDLMQAEAMTAVNPVLINWMREAEDSASGLFENRPFRFHEWKNRNRARMLMGDIIRWKAPEEIYEEKTHERLLSVYNHLKALLEPSENSVENTVAADASQAQRPPLVMSDSRQRYRYVRAEIYPHLNIADEILAQVKTSVRDKHLMTVRVRDDRNQTHRLYDAVTNLWQKKPGQWHAVLIGEGGMGKTVSLLKLWKELLAADDNAPIPVFLRLETYNQIKPERRRDYIIYAITQEYRNRVPFENDIKALENQMKQADEKKRPAVVLLLDGYNEVTADTTDLLVCLKNVRLEMAGVQIIISSRYDMRTTLGWNEFDKLGLEALTDKQIQSFMQSVSLSFDPELIDAIPLLRNPMMLTLYCGLEQEMQNSLGKRDYDFIPDPVTKAEILHDFMAASLARQDRRAVTPDERLMHRLMLRYLILRIGFEMEKAGLFEMPYSQLQAIIQDQLAEFQSDAFLDAHPEIDQAMSEPLHQALTPSIRPKRRAIMHKLTREYALLRQLQSNTFAFLHQDFRDYFAACHLVLKIEEGLARGKNDFPVLAERVLPFHLRAMLGQYTREHLRQPVIKEGRYLHGNIRETLLDRALDQLRGVEMQTGDFRILNILETLKETREDLSDTDLSGLDLRHVVLNGVRLGHRIIDGQEHGSNLSDAWIGIRTLFSQGHSGSVQSVSYSPDGQHVVSAGDHTLREWNVVTGECIRIFKGHPNIVKSACYSPDGRYIISTSADSTGDGNNTLREWDAATGECVRIFEGHSSWVNSASYSPDGKRIISASNDGTVREWNAETGECIRIFEGHSSEVFSVGYNPIGRRIISASNDGALREWDVAAGKCIRIFEGHSNRINSACYSPNGQRVIIASSDGTLREWDTVTGKCIRIFENNSSAESVAYSPDGSRIISACWDNTLKEWDATTGDCIRIFKGHSSWINSVNYNLNGQRIISGSADNSLREWDTVTGRCIRYFGGSSNFVNSANYSSDGQRVISANCDYTLKEWCVLTGELIRIFVGHSYEVTSAIYSPNGLRIISASKDKTLREWYVATGECIRIFEGHSDWVNSANYSPDGQRIISASTDNTLREWNTANGECIRIYEGHNRSVATTNITSACYSPDGKRIVSASADTTLREWDTATGGCINIFKGHCHIVNSASYRQDARRMVSGSIDNTFREWDVETGECIRIFENRSKGNISASYILNELRIIYFCWDKTLEEWDMETSVLINTFKVDHSEFIRSACYSPDGRRILSTSNDGTVKEWDTKTGKCIRTIKNIPGLLIQGADMRNLHPDSEITDEEKGLLRQYGAMI